jgi:hypothetical protein
VLCAVGPNLQIDRRRAQANPPESQQSNAKQRTAITFPLFSDSCSQSNSNTTAADGQAKQSYAVRRSTRAK